MAHALINEIIIGELQEVAGYEENAAINIFRPVVAAVVADDLGNQQMDLERLIQHRGEKRPHNEGYFENVVPLYDIDDFKSHFRMSPQTMQ
ncbi:hypothetical protein LSTR_LSTR015731, partial [Laodelphax striatellus]